MAVGDGESVWNVRNDFGRKKGEEMTFFLSYTKAKAEMLKLEMLSRTEASSTLQTSLLKDPNGQIVYNCLVKLQTKFREDPTVNEGWAVFLPKQLM